MSNHSSPSDTSIHHFSEDSSFDYHSDNDFDGVPSNVLPTPITSPVTAPLNDLIESPPRSPINTGFGTPPTSPPHTVSNNPDMALNILEIVPNDPKVVPNSPEEESNDLKVVSNINPEEESNDPEEEPNNSGEESNSPEMIPNKATVNEFNKPFIPIQSCYCVVCLKCFYCLQSYSRSNNNYCLCEDTLIPSLPKTYPDSDQVMKINVYKRAFIIDWVKRHADNDTYDLSNGFNIEDGEIISVPLCDEHQSLFDRQWLDHEELLTGLGIMVLDDAGEDQLESGFTHCTFRFRGWQDNRPTYIRYVDVPERALEDRLFILTDSIADTFGYQFHDYIEELGMTDEEFDSLRFFDPLSNIIYRPEDDIADAFRRDGILHRTFDVGLDTTRTKRSREDDDNSQDSKRMKHGVKHLYSE